MLKNKKAQGISLETIIVAAIVLIVLVVLIMVFTGRMGWFNIGFLNATSGKLCGDYKYEKGSANWALENECPIQNRIIDKFSDQRPGYVCCKPE